MKRILLVGLFLIIGSAHAQSTDRPLMLVAAPVLQGLYSRTAVIVLPFADRHLGFIVNRATDTTLAGLFPEHPPSAKVVDPVHFGGPERVNALFAIVRHNPGAQAMPLFAGLHLVSQASAIDRVIEQNPGDARFFAGFVAWQPGELEKEIDAGFWYLAEADAALFFRPDTSRLWEELVQQFGNDLTPQRRRGRLLSASVEIYD
jgi:putative AlgH/UPF0301 family transcriptional regulator